MDKRFSDCYATVAPDELSCSPLEMAWAAWQAAQSTTAEQALKGVSLFGELQAALERIAELEAAIAASAQDAAAIREDEREDCIKVCMLSICGRYEKGTIERRAWNEGTVDCADAIRAAIKEPKP
jgi:hypothetical protein